MIQELRGYPEKLKTYVQNFIQTDRETIVNAAETDLRPILRPIEQREQALNSDRRQREIELKETEKKKQQLAEEFKRNHAKNSMAVARLTEILNQLDNKMKCMEQEGYA
jgi:DNA repair exonuclease SbcCD ATPase subunit